VVPSACWARVGGGEDPPKPLFSSDAGRGGLLDPRRRSRRNVVPNSASPIGRDSLREAQHLTPLGSQSGRGVVAAGLRQRYRLGPFE
jgi:hypothetical protein